MLVDLEPPRLVQGLCCTMKPGDGAVDLPDGCVVNGLGNFFDNPQILHFWLSWLSACRVFFFLFF